ncbi:MAG: catechol 1,2-dioxygenase, partial [Mesorhizobium sp.]
HEEPHPTEADIPGPWFSLDYTYAMEPGEAVLPRPPIK